MNGIIIFLFLLQVNVEGRQILVLLDVEFILRIQTYVNSIYENMINPEKNELVQSAMQSLKNAGQQHKKVKFELAETSETVENVRGFKLQGVVEKFAVALLDPEQTVEQVVILQVYPNCITYYQGLTMITIRPVYSVTSQRMVVRGKQSYH